MGFFETLIVDFCLVLIVIPLFLYSIYCRFVKKKINIGLGPIPLINYIYHKKALQKKGYTAETFVNEVYFITNDFDIRFDRYLLANRNLINKIINKVIKLFINLYMPFFVMRRYDCLYISFEGGPFGIFAGKYLEILKRIEPLLFKISKTKVLILPYGADVQELSRSKNLLFKNAMSLDYPKFKLSRSKISKQIDLWTKHADHLISGVDWVEYMYHWDTLLLGHFCIDIEKYERVEKTHENIFRVLHAPNHKNIKGTAFIERIINELKSEGYAIELIILEKQPNAMIKKTISQVDLVIDQLVIGWYAMFTLEALSLGTPVICYLRDDFLNLFENAGIARKDDIPIINSNFEDLKEKIKYYIDNKNELEIIGKKSIEFVKKYHSLEYMGDVFDKINKSIGVQPTGIDK